MHYMGSLQQIHSCVKKTRAVRSLFHTKVLYSKKNIFATHIFTTASAVKPTERTTKKKQFHVMMKNLFTSSSGSDSISCGIPRCIAGEERDDTMDSRDVIVSGEVEIKFRG